mmetsp:Transcript_43604/g.115130  ORF Transcript_43604/g.115130 Transcript_43604/m.115130 type:complete len:364 (+) Transcript_43604:284-1375(+)
MATASAAFRLVTACLSACLLHASRSALASASTRCCSAACRACSASCSLARVLWRSWSSCCTCSRCRAAMRAISDSSCTDAVSWESSWRCRSSTRCWRSWASRVCNCPPPPPVAAASSALRALSSAASARRSARSALSAASRARVCAAATNASAASARLVAASNAASIARSRADSPESLPHRPAASLGSSPAGPGVSTRLSTLGVAEVDTDRGLGARVAFLGVVGAQGSPALGAPSSPGPACPALSSRGLGPPCPSPPDTARGLGPAGGVDRPGPALACAWGCDELGHAAPSCGRAGLWRWTGSPAAPRAWSGAALAGVTVASRGQTAGMSCWDEPVDRAERGVSFSLRWPASFRTSCDNSSTS